MIGTLYLGDSGISFFDLNQIRRPRAHLGFDELLAFRATGAALFTTAS
jgi:hypothetical protein